MNALILLLTGLVCAQAAPQFLFVLPPEFLNQIQKPVGEMSQFGQQPHIPVFSLESLLGTASTPAETIVPAPFVPEVAEVMTPTDLVAEVASETVAQIVMGEPVPEQAALIEVSMAEETVPIFEAPVEETMAKERAPLVQEVPIEAVVMEEVIAVVQEVSAATPAQEVTTDSTIVIQATEPARMILHERIVPVEEVVTPTIVEEVVTVEDVQSNTVQEVVIVEEVSPMTNIATTQGPVDVHAAASISSINKQSISAPTNEIVDPRLSVDPRFLNYIYVNDAPDVVAAKVALFNLQASLLPKLPVQESFL